MKPEPLEYHLHQEVQWSPQRMGGIQLWFQPARGAEPGEVTSILSPEEQARYQQIQHPGARDTFFTGRVILRQILAQALNEPPADVPIALGPHGAPHLPARYGLHFNLSHAGGWVLCGTAPHPIGVDLEDAGRAARIDALSRRFFSEAEYQSMQVLPEAEKRQRFFELWTLKEATIKALGVGFAQPIRDLSFDMAGDSPRLHPAPSATIPPGEQWAFTTFPLAPHHQAAIAVLRTRSARSAPL